MALHTCLQGLSASWKHLNNSPFLGSSCFTGFYHHRLVTMTAHMHTFPQNICDCNYYIICSFYGKYNYVVALFCTTTVLVLEPLCAL